MGWKLWTAAGLVAMGAFGGARVEVPSGQGGTSTLEVPELGDIGRQAGEAVGDAVGGAAGGVGLDDAAKVGAGLGLGYGGWKALQGAAEGISGGIAERIRRGPTIREPTVSPTTEPPANRPEPMDDPPQRPEPLAPGTVITLPPAWSPLPDAAGSGEVVEPGLLPGPRLGPGGLVCPDGFGGVRVEC